jgi:hypothetical protein
MSEQIHLSPTQVTRTCGVPERAAMVYQSFDSASRLFMKAKLKWPDELLDV